MIAHHIKMMCTVHESLTSAQGQGHTFGLKSDGEDMFLYEKQPIWF